MGLAKGYRVGEMQDESPHSKRDSMIGAARKQRPDLP